MANERILVTGASGQQGGAVARALLAQGAKVLASSRNPDKLADLKEQGAEVVALDLGDRASIDAALDGVDRAFLVATPFEAGTDAETELGNRFADAANDAGLKFLLFTSVGSADRDTGIPHFESKWKTEEHIRGLGLKAAFLRPVWFMENFGSPWFLPSIQGGTLSLPQGADTKLQMVSIETIGAMAAKILLNPDDYAGQGIELASDEISLSEAMAQLGEATSKTIRFETMPEDQAAGALGDDFAMMFKWFEDIGFAADIEGLKRHGIPMPTFKEHLAKAAWVSQV